MGICQSTKQDSNDMYKTKTLNSTMTRKQNTKDISTSNHNITKTTSAFSNSKERFYTKESISDKKTNSTSRSKAYVKMKSVDVKTSEKLKARNPLRHTSSEKDLKVSAGLVVNCNSENPKDKYKILKKVGEGGYGTVWKVQHIKTGLIRAMKRIPKVRKKNVKVEEIINEIETLKKLDHPNIVKIFEFFVEADGYYLITEYCNYGELFDVIKEKGFLSEEIAANIMYQIFSAVYYCHSTSNIIHRDIKPENILIESIDQNTHFYNIKIIDFGTAKIYEKNKNEDKIIGSAYYIAPEVLNKNYNEKCDIWSCGVILYILLCGKVPFNGKNDSEILQKIKGGKYDLNRHPFESVSDEAKDLIKKCLDLNVNRRINARSALNHKWFRNLETKKYFSEVNEFFLHSVIENLISYSPKNKLQEIALTYLVHNFPNLDEIKNINKIYCLLNKSKNGQLTKKEMKKYLSQYIPSTSQLELDTKIESIFSNIDNDNNGFIEFEEFARAGINKKIFLDEKVLHFVFDFIDKDLSGEITLHELKEVFGLQHDSEAEKVLVNLIKEIDLDGNGRISFNEFKYMITHIIN